MSEKHRIYFEPVGIEIEVSEDERILDAAFKQNVHLMHGCREGQCSACKSFVLDGDIQMDKYSTFACNDSEVEDGFVLLCRAHAFEDCTIELLNFDEDELFNATPIQDVDCEVLSVVELTGDMVSLKMRPLGGVDFDFKPGQYTDVLIPGGEDGEKRSFSMATTPISADHLEFIIKKYPGGQFSSLLDDGIAAGTQLHLNGPYGNCTIKEGRVLPIVGIAGGAGMAPILSLLRHLAETNSDRSVHFYYGARRIDDLFYIDEIREIGKKLKDFRFVVGLSDELPAEWGYEDVVLEEGFIHMVAERHEPTLRSTEVYMCGPPPMVDAATEMLESQMVPSDQVFFDKFTSPMTPESV
ncbi:2Fe-2S iron-sulfur cluster binding domain-containing protein [Dietzia sp. ANT_WB102]|uniref:2Fe-2S iron-sulfur cluster-binding protein n=1 Tax=Dietzia sp. ANT_WB102 TaxID=2597345 RepID=UPI0011EE8649|nr:2Fe-2S iron-sulfur cluster binding domain-containing protein [Dietzia sp. ANT_WB102]KAA0918308.1 2Fe-2S iron-sulfur cluster binding domain-containing protein [Dietzia sp. ANT_WB102]